LLNSSNRSILVVTTVLLLDVVPENLHSEDDAVVFSAASHRLPGRPRSRRVAARPARAIEHLFDDPCCSPGSYTTSRDSISQPNLTHAFMAGDEQHLRCLALR